MCVIWSTSGSIWEMIRIRQIHVQCLYFYKSFSLHETKLTNKKKIAKYKTDPGCYLLVRLVTLMFTYTSSVHFTAHLKMQALKSRTKKIEMSDRLQRAAICDTRSSRPRVEYFLKWNLLGKKLLVHGPLRNIEHSRMWNRARITKECMYKKIPEEKATWIYVEKARFIYSKIIRRPVNAGTS